MSLVIFVLAIFASVRSFVESFAVAATNAIQLDMLPKSVEKIINSIAKNMGISIEAVTDVAIREPEVVTASWLLVGASFVGVIGGILCLVKKKVAAFFLLISGLMCAAGGFIADGKMGIAFAYAIIFLLAALLAFCAKPKQDVQTAISSKSAKPVSTPATSQKISLKKGDKVSLTKTYPISKIVIGLGWSVNKKNNGDFDLDASAFLLSGNDKVAQNTDFIFYGNKVHSSGAVEHMGDNLTGSSGKNDDEQIKIDLTRMPSNINKIVFVVTIYEAEERKQNFGQVSSAFIRIFDEENSRELVRYDLAEKFSTETAVICGELYKDGSEWSFNATGNGFTGSLKGLCEKYGVAIEN